MCVALVAGVHNGNTPAAVAGAAGRCWGPSSSMAMPRGGVITVMHPLRQAAEICNQFAVCARLLPPPSPSRPHIILRRAATQMKTSESFLSPSCRTCGLQNPHYGAGTFGKSLRPARAARRGPHCSPCAPVAPPATAPHGPTAQSSKPRPQDLCVRFRRPVPLSHLRLSKCTHSPGTR